MSEGGSETWIGPYRLVRQLGEGGMGVVYEAEQTEPVRRRVALKLLRPGRSDAELVTRFAAERQALALMGHPNIARIHDAGTTGDGRPYFVMELVDGEPLTTFADAHELSLEERLQLVIRCGHAVHHAHQRGIIHRDLKPTNILVTTVDGVPTPKIIDLGVAKAIGTRLVDETVRTQFGHVVGTPAYMSPEQADPTILDLDVRTDVYSLGVVLFELIVGRLPVDPAEVGLGAFLASLDDHDSAVPTPSHRFRSLDLERQRETARARGTEPQRLRHHLSGDLAWIVLRALEKDRIRRYDTARGLAEDLERYLRKEPVDARPPTPGYRLRKFVRRNRIMVGAAAAVALALLGGTIAATMGFVRASREAETARQTADFLVGLFAEGDPARARGDDIPVREILDRAAPRLDSTLTNQPLVRATLLHTLGTVYRELAEYEKAVPLLERSLRIREEGLGADHLDVGLVLADLGDAMLKLDRAPEAEAALGRARSIFQRAGEAGSLAAARVYPLLAERRRLEERYDSALALTQLALDALEHAADPDLPRPTLGGRTPRQELALTRLYRGILLRDINEFDRAEADMTAAVPLIGQTLGEDHPRYGMSLISFGYLYFKQGRYDEAVPHYRRSLAFLERVFGPEHPETAVALNELARAVCSLGALEEAEALWRRAFQIREAVFGPGHIATAQASWNLGSILTALGRYDEADSFITRSLETTRASQGDGAEGVGMAHLHRANWALRQGLAARARASVDTALSVYSRLGVDRPENLLWAMQLEAGLDRDAGLWDRADSVYQAAIELQSHTLGPSGADYAALLEEYAILKERRGEPEAARELRARAQEASPLRRYRGC